MRDYSWIRHPVPVHVNRRQMGEEGSVGFALVVAKSKAVRINLCHVIVIFEGVIHHLVVRCTYLIPEMYNVSMWRFAQGLPRCQDWWDLRHLYSEAHMYCNVRRVLSEWFQTNEFQASVLQSIGQLALLEEYISTSTYVTRLKQSHSICVTTIESMKMLYMLIRTAQGQPEDVPLNSASFSWLSD